MIAGPLGTALLLLIAQPSAAQMPPAVPSAPASLAFAPPMERPMTYRVTSRRLSRDGTLASYTMVYALEWRRAGRGVQLSATLRRIESDARPEFAGTLTKMLQPLVGEAMTYLVAPDGSSVDLIDPEGLWQRVLDRAQAMGANAEQGDARRMGSLLAALPAKERDRLATSDIRALIAAANPALAADMSAAAATDGPTQIITRAEDAAVGEGARPLRIDMAWTVDRATGLVLQDRRQSWITAPGSAEKTLVEERLRALSFTDPS